MLISNARIMRDADRLLADLLDGITDEAASAALGLSLAVVAQVRAAVTR